MHFALRDGNRWRSHFRIPTHGSSASLRRILSKKLKALRVSEAFIASVVPAKGRELKTILKKNGVDAKLLGIDLRVPIVNRYRNPKQVGIDRLLNALAAYKKHRRELIIVDFGTAITFDI